MNDIKNEIDAWLESEDYYKGIQILSQYGKNKAMVRILSINPNPSKKAKLLYELRKIAGLLESNPANSNLKIKVTGKIPDKTNVPADNLKSDVPFNLLPVIIQEISRQKGRLYMNREILHNQLTDETTQDNKPENKTMRANVGENIKHVSERIDALYAAEQDYKKNKTIPSEDFVYNWNPDLPKKNDTSFPDITKLSDVELTNRKTNLRTYITKDENMLNFQLKATKKEANPMPSGPKRDKIERKIAAQKEEIKAIEEQLKKHAGKS
jgi:hypothetical protein